MIKKAYDTPSVYLVVFEVDDVVRTSPNDDGAINGGDTSDIANNWWAQ